MYVVCVDPLHLSISFLFSFPPPADPSTHRLSLFHIHVPLSSCNHHCMSRFHKWVRTCVYLSFWAWLISFNMIILSFFYFLQMTWFQFINSLVVGCLCWFQRLAVVNIAAINMDMQVTVLYINWFILLQIYAQEWYGRLTR
jgi:hypothetical protein